MNGGSSQSVSDGAGYDVTEPGLFRFLHPMQVR
jgi:hypothetical protein